MTARTASTSTQIHLYGEPGTLTVARDQRGQVTLVDLRAGRHGSTLGGLADALASALTLALRHGAPADLLVSGVLGAATVPAQRAAGSATALPPRSPRPAPPPPPRADLARPAPARACG